MFQFVSKRFETIESVDLDILNLFQYVSVSLLYNVYVSMFRNTRYGAWNFHLYMFQSVSKRLYVSMFQFVAKHIETHGVTCFNIVLKRFETGET